MRCAPECGCTLACSAPNSCFDAIDRELLDLVDDFAAAVVALARQPLGVLVGERRAHRLHHGRRHEVLAGDQLDAIVLTDDLRLDQRRDLGVRRTQRGARRATVPVIPLLHHVSSSAVCPFDLGDPAFVPAALERRVEPRLQNLHPFLVADTTRREAPACSHHCARAPASATSGVHATAARTCG